MQTVTSQRQLPKSDHEGPAKLAPTQRNVLRRTSGYPTQLDPAGLDIPFCVAVKELSLSYHNPETILLTKYPYIKVIYPYYGNLSQCP